MKTINKEELYEHLSGFLKTKGIELKEGSYTRGIHAGCSLLADAVNLSQAGIERARTELNRQVDHVRQVIHEKTAPKKSSAGPHAQPKKSSPTNTRPRPNRKRPAAKRKNSPRTKKY